MAGGHESRAETALAPVIGCDQAAAISYYATDHDLTPKQAALAKGVTEEFCDREGQEWGVMPNGI
jgi:fumarate hydratase class II